LGDDDIACELLSYSAVSVAKPFHWFTAESLAGTPHEIASGLPSRGLRRSWSDTSAAPGASKPLGYEPEEAPT